jgi:hypothetical protein
MMMETLEKVESLAAAPTEFPPPIFAGSDSILVFWCFCSPLLEKASGVNTCILHHQYSDLYDLF